MSLLVSQRMFAGHDQCSVASLEANGNFYKCYVYLNRTQWRVEALCMRVQPSGAEVIVFHNYVASATAQEIDDTAGIPLDCPKIIAVGTSFVVHWLQATTTVTVGGSSARDWDLCRAYQDMTSFSATAWIDEGSVPIYEFHALYDVAPIGGSSTDFMVVRYVAVGATGDTIRVERYDSPAWLDINWDTDITITINPTVLSVYGNDTDDDVLVSYERTSDGFLYTARLDASDGTNTATVQTFTSLPACSFFQVKHTRVHADRVAVVAEVRLDAYLTADVLLYSSNFIHHLAYRAINSATAAPVDNEHWCPNLYMLSEPWAYSGDVYVLVAYKSITTYNDWAQSYAFAVRLNYGHWDEAAGASVRPRPIATIYTSGLPDGRASGWKPDGTLHQGGPVRRCNHVSHVAGAPPFGPDVKTRTVAMVTWGALGLASVLQDPSQAYNAVSNPYVTSLQAERAGVRGVVVYLDDPWTVYTLDSANPTQPDENFVAAYPRTMHQSFPAGRGIFVAGGTPHTYDGRKSVECGFPWKPEILVVNQITGTDQVVGELAGTYQAYACYSWTDNAGQTHRSGPSNVVTWTMQAPDDAVIYRVRSQNISVKDASVFDDLAQSIQIEIYRTINLNNGGGTFYKVFAATEQDLPAPANNFRARDTPENDPTAPYVDVYDGLADVRLELQALAPYQFDADGVFVEPLPMTTPAMSVVTGWNNRLWGADALDPAVIYYTDEILPDYGAAFYLVPVWTTQLTFRIGEVGEITGMCAMNNALIVFTRDAIYSLTAQSAASTSNPALLNVQAEALHSGTGCIEPRSVLLTPLGIMFQSAKGYYLLSRNRELGYYALSRSRDEAFSTSGSEIEEDILDGGNIRAASLLEDRHQVRLVTNGAIVTTQTWEIGFTIPSDSVGTYAITGLPDTVSVEIANGSTPNDVVDALIAVITPLLSTTLQFTVDSVVDNGTSLDIVLLPDVELTLDTDVPPATTATSTLTEEIETQPRVLIYDYLLQKWSRADLVQTSATTRLAEAMDGCSWHGNEGGTMHVVLAQGGLLVERSADDPLAFTDQTSVGDVGIPLHLRTSWMVLASLAGYVRVRSIGVQTERFNDAALSAMLEYDLDGSYEGQAIYPTYYSWASPAPAYLRIRPEQQKVNAVRMSIYEEIGITNSENLAVVAIVLDVGIKPGLKRVSDAQIGST